MSRPINQIKGTEETTLIAFSSDLQGNRSIEITDDVRRYIGGYNTNRFLITTGHERFFQGLCFQGTTLTDYRRLIPATGTQFRSICKLLARHSAIRIHE